MIIQIKANEKHFQEVMFIMPHKRDRNLDPLKKLKQWQPCMQTEYLSDFVPLLLVMCWLHTGCVPLSAIPKGNELSWYASATDLLVHT